MRMIAIIVLLMLGGEQAQALVSFSTWGCSSMFDWRWDFRRADQKMSFHPDVPAGQDLVILYYKGKPLRSKEDVITPQAQKFMEEFAHTDIHLYFLWNEQLQVGAVAAPRSQLGHSLLALFLSPEQTILGGVRYRRLADGTVTRYNSKDFKDLPGEKIDDQVLEVAPHYVNPVAQPLE